MEETGNIIREFGENYTCIPCDILHDSRISLKARGLYATVMGFPKDWQLTVKGLQSILKEGRDAIYAALKELEQTGYVTRSQSNGRGRFGSVSYVLHSRGTGIPHTDLPLTEKPYTDFPDTENPTQYSNIKNIISNNKEETLKEEKPKKTSLSLDIIPMADGFHELMVMWLDYKRQIKDAYKTQIGLQRCYTQLYKLSNGNAELAKQIIDQSIANEYKGLFPLKNNGYGTTDRYSTRSQQRELETIARRSQILRTINGDATVCDGDNEAVRLTPEF